MRFFAPAWAALALGTIGMAEVEYATAQAPNRLGPSAAQLPSLPPPAAMMPVPDLPPGTILRPGEVPIDLGMALELAGVRNPELLLARQRVVEAAANRQLAAAQLLPNINVGTNVDTHQGPVQQSNGNILNVNRGAMFLGLGANAVAAGSVNIPGIYYNLNVGNAWFTYLRTRQATERMRAESAAFHLDIFLRTCLGYSELLRAEGHRAIAVKNRADVAEIARLTAAYAAAGQGRKADADRAAVELRRRDLEMTQAEAQLLTASARLCQVLNLDPSIRLKPTDGWVVPAPVVPDALPLQELLAIAMLQRPELAARRAEIREALYGLANARLLPFSPNMILGFSAGTFGGGSNLLATGLPQPNGSTLTGSTFGQFAPRADTDVVVYWTAQNMGIGNLALIRIARSQTRQSEFRQLETLNRVRAEVAESNAHTHARFVQIGTLESAVRSSQQAYDQDLTRIKGREGLPIEVIDSVRLLSRSRNDYLDTIIDYNRAQFQLYVALGRPPAAALARPIPADLVPPPTTARRHELPAPNNLQNKPR